jgi:hypothetical protein
MADFAKFAKFANRQRGSALTEAAIVIPVLVVLLFWAIAMTDVMVLRVKTAEAARYALWETTVFRQQSEITQDVAQRFRDLRSPASVNSEFTGLLLYPQAANVILSAQVQSARTVSIGGRVRLDNPTGLIDKFLSLLLSTVTGTVDGATRFFRFNTRGTADVRARLVRASHIGSKIMMGGNLLGDTGGDDLDHSEEMQNLTFQTPLPNQNPMRLVYDTWKAWPKPGAFTTDGAKTNVTVSPMQTYQTVEEQVSSQVNNVAFYGAKQAIGPITDFLAKANANSVIRAIFGGTMPDVLGTTRMDSSQRGPITIRPVDRPDQTFVPSYRPGGTLQEGAHRLGELAGYGGNGVTANYPKTAMIDGQDRSRYTVPYMINSQYFTDNGGNDRNIFVNKRKTMPANLAKNNEYVKTYQCRGHFFAGGTTAQQDNFDKRYRPNCYSKN